MDFFDTASSYQNGTSEQFVGKAIQATTARNNVVIATKFLPRVGEQQTSFSTQQQFAKCLACKVAKNLQNKNQINDEKTLQVT
ncbi:aldo/keto reductase [Agarivorans sp. 3_MG-2023]|uniref:aldo/keto reductase n=1 Tax=Agarivorans sp. 3_MG-2023 TaxID=3062648 RepID=UPI003FA4AD38